MSPIETSPSILFIEESYRVANVEYQMIVAVSPPPPKW